MIVRLKKYHDLITFCFREQLRYQELKELNNVILADREFFRTHYMVYRAENERLKQQLKDRSENGRYRKVIPITSMSKLS